MEDCGHGQTILCKNVASNGQVQYAYQCQECGKQSVWLRHSALTEEQRAGAMDMDKTVSQRWYERKHQERKSEWEADRLAAEREREKKDAAWWTKYERYLSSEEWALKRNRRLELNRTLFGGYCEICFAGKAVRCHHITYSRVFAEWVLDLAAVCERCHSKLHPDRDL